MDEKELMAMIDKAYAQLVEEHGELAPSKEYFEMIVVKKFLDKIDDAILHGI